MTKEEAVKHVQAHIDFTSVPLPEFGTEEHDNYTIELLSHQIKLRRAMKEHPDLTIGTRVEILTPAKKL